MESSVTAHVAFQRWALWTLQPDPGYPGGVGVDALQRILDGKGTILPGPPKKSGPRRVWSDSIAAKVEEFICTLEKKDQQLIRVYYLSRYDVHERASHLGLPTRTMYYRLGVIYKKFDLWRKK